MLFGIMPEGTISDFEELRGPRANPTRFLQGSLQVHSLGGSDNLFKIHALLRYFDALTGAPRGFRITQDPVGQDSHGNLLARLQGHGALHGVCRLEAYDWPGRWRELGKGVAGARAGEGERGITECGWAVRAVGRGGRWRGC